VSSPARPPRRSRLIAVVVLALWMAPGAGALAVGVHLAFGHGHGVHDGDDHRRAAMELALAAVHGHHHDLAAVPGHEHAAPSGGGPSVPANALEASTDPPPIGPAPRLPGLAAGTLSAARRGRSTLLYCTHCSLLL
jgi:hypothetical protein